MVSVEPQPDGPEARRQETIATCEIVESQLTSLQLDRTTFQRFAEAVRGSPAVRSTHFPHSVASWYAQSVLVGLRRIGDRDPRSRSLRALFDRMIAHPEDWTLAVVSELFDAGPHPYDRGMIDFLAASTYKFVADASGRALNVERVTIDSKRLEDALSKVKHVVDRTIAHTDSRGSNDVTITYDELHEVIRVCEDIAKPYVALFTGRGYSSLTPVEQTTWWSIFEPWKHLEAGTF